MERSLAEPREPGSVQGVAIPWQRVALDAGAFALLGGVLIWWPLADGGRTRTAATTVALLAVLAAPAAVEGARTLGRIERALLVWFALALVIHPFLGGWRDALDEPLLRYATVPVIYLVGRYVAVAWRRALPGVFAVAAVWLWAQGVSGWFDPPGTLFVAWRSLPWHNPSGIVLGAFAVVWTGLAGSVQGRWWHTVPATVALAGLFLSGSRASIAMSTLAVAVIVAWHVRSRGAASRLVVLLLAATMLSWGALQVTAYDGSWDDPGGSSGTSPLGSRADPSGSVDRRTMHAQAAVRLFARQPLLGTGLGSYGHGIMEAADPRMNFTRSVHNEPLEVLAEGGLFLGLPFGLLHAAAVVGLVPLVFRRREPVVSVSAGAALLIVGHTLFDIDWAYPYVPALAVVLAGVARAWRASGSTADVDLERRRVPVASVLALALPLALAIGVAAEISVAGGAGRPPLWHAEPHVRASWAALAQGDAATAQTEARDAVRAAPRDPVVAELVHLSDLAGRRDADALWAIAVDPATPLRSALAAAAALVPLSPGTAQQALEDLTRRLGTYHPERVEPLVPEVERLLALIS